MKRIITVVMCSVMMLWVSGCGNNSASNAQYAKLKAEVMPVISNEANIKYWENTPDISTIFGAKFTQLEVDAVASKLKVRKAQLTTVQPKIEELRRLSEKNSSLKKDFKDNVEFYYNRCGSSVRFNEMNVREFYNAASRRTGSPVR